MNQFKIETHNFFRRPRLNRTPQGAARIPQGAADCELTILNPKPFPKSTTSFVSLKKKMKTTFLSKSSPSHWNPQSGMIMAPTGGDQQQEKAPEATGGQKTSSDSQNSGCFFHQESLDSNQSSAASLRRISTSQKFQENISDCQVS